MFEKTLLFRLREFDRVLKNMYEFNRIFAPFFQAFSGEKLWDF